MNSEKLRELGDPFWVDVQPAGEFLGLADKTVLHSGPPIEYARMCEGHRRSMVNACLFCGWGVYTAEIAANLAWMRDSLFADLVAVLKAEGGFPLCWPWSVFEGEKGCKIHGFTRYVTWRVAKRSDDSVTLALDDSYETRAVWPHRFHAELTYRIGKNNFSAEFVVKNTGERKFACTELMHPYFRVGDAAKCSVEGLDGLRYFWKGEPDLGCSRRWKGGFSGGLFHDKAPGYVFEKERDTPLCMVDPVLNRVIRLDYQGNRKYCIWGSCADFSAYGASDDPEFGRRYLCVEGGTIYRDCAYSLSPGESHKLSVSILVTPKGKLKQ